MRSVNVNTGGKEVEFKERFKLDPARKPKQIDLTSLDGEAPKGNVLGLYEIDGDTLKLCFFDLPPRPRTLDSKEEVLRKMVLIFKKASR
jgi:uncharacterized protein (TIGR03067 family)